MKRLLTTLAVLPLVACSQGQTPDTEMVTVTTVVEAATESGTLAQQPAEPAQPENKVIPVEALETLEVPPLCGHEGGRLVNGKLPVEKHSQYPNALAQLSRNKDGTPQGAYTDINGDGRDEAVVAYNCDKGGASWPTNLLIYDNDLNFITAVSDWTEGDMTALRAHIRGLRWDDSKVYVDTYGWMPGDASVAPSRLLTYELTLNGTEPVLTLVSNEPNPNKGI